MPVSCFSFLLQSIEEVAPSTAPAIAFQHLMLIRTEEEVQKLFRDQTFDAWAESTRESRPHSKCILIVYGSGKLRKNFSTHNQMTVTQLKNDLQILFIDDLAKCVSFIFYFTKALAKEKLFDDEFVSNAKSVKVNAQHQVGLQKLWEAQLKILKSVNGIMAKAAVTESAAEFRAKSLDNASSNSNNPRTLPVVLAKVLSSTNGAENCIN